MYPVEFLTKHVFDKLGATQLGLCLIWNKTPYSRLRLPIRQKLTNKESCFYHYLIRTPVFPFGKDCLVTARGSIVEHNQLARKAPLMKMVEVGSSTQSR